MFQENKTLVEVKSNNLSEEETCFELIEDAGYIDHCTYYIEVVKTLGKNLSKEQTELIFKGVGLSLFSLLGLLTNLLSFLVQIRYKVHIQILFRSDIAIRYCSDQIYI